MAYVDATWKDRSFDAYSSHYYSFCDYIQRILGHVWWELKGMCNLCNIMNSAIRYFRYRVYLGREGNASKRRDVNEWIHVSVVFECETRMDMYTLQAMSAECNHYLNTSFIRMLVRHQVRPDERGNCNRNFRNFPRNSLTNTLFLHPTTRIYPD